MDCKENPMEAMLALAGKAKKLWTSLDQLKTPTEKFLYVFGPDGQELRALLPVAIGREGNTISIDHTQTRVLVAGDETEVRLEGSYGSTTREVDSLARLLESMFALAGLEFNANLINYEKDSYGFDWDYTLKASEDLALAVRLDAKKRELAAKELDIKELRDTVKDMNEQVRKRRAAPDLFPEDQAEKHKKTG